jgi:hypothetical protein
MILYTGDTHGDVTRIQKIAYEQNLTENEYALYLEANRDIINKIIKQRSDK